MNEFTEYRHPERQAIDGKAFNLAKAARDKGIWKDKDMYAFVAEVKKMELTKAIQYVNQFEKLLDLWGKG